MTYRSLVRYLVRFGLPVLLILCTQAHVPAEWLYYDDGEAVHASSGLRYQGVRFSLPADVVRAPLLQAAFFYVTDAAFCPVTIHITDHNRSASITDRIPYNAVNGWNYLDLSPGGISVPHNFYVILENSTCGFLMLDNQDLSERSFKGNYLKSMTTRLSHDLLIRAETGEPWEISVLKEWNVSLSEKITIKQKGAATQKIVNDLIEIWTLFEDNSLMTGNDMYGIMYGLWKQKGKKFMVSLDSEDIRTHLLDILPDYVTGEIADVMVTKVKFTGKILADESIKGTLKIYAKISFFDSHVAAKMTLERKLAGIPVQLLEPETGGEPE